jgi:hypothetical protein
MKNWRNLDTKARSFHKVLNAIQSINPLESTCSICIQPFLAIIAEGESAKVMESPAFFSGDLGVTRLSQPWQCGHLFCRRELRFLSFHSLLIQLQIPGYFLELLFSRVSTFSFVPLAKFPFGMECN